MSAKQVAPIWLCAECRAVWLRWFVTPLTLLTLLTIVTAGCGDARRAVTTKSRSASVKHRRCTPATGDFRICKTWHGQYDYLPDDSWIEHRVDGRWRKLVGDPEPDFADGPWIRVLPAPNGRTLLAEEVGEGCDTIWTFLVSTSSGKASETFRETDTRALGWTTDGRARIRLMTGDRFNAFGPGVYRVDPVSLAVKRERPAASAGC